MQIVTEKTKTVAEIAAWLDTLYGQCTPEDGALVVVAPERNRIHAAFKLGCGDFLVEAARCMAETPGLYLKINPMDYDAILQRGRSQSVVGNQSEVKSIVSIHLDVDAGKSDKYLSREQAIDCLGAMPHPPTLIVNSDGDDGGFHAYWILASPYRIEDEVKRRQVCLAAYRWQEHLRQLAGGRIDSTANIDRVLRVVGGRRRNGNRVSCHQYWPERLYSLRQLWLPATMREKSRTRRRKVESLQKAHFGDSGAASDKPITEYLRSNQLSPQQLLEGQGYHDLGGGQWRRPGSQTGARSLKVATDHTGINVFSGSDPFFQCLDEDGRPGAFHSVEAMFVNFMFGGDWSAAGRFCQSELTTQMLKESKAG